MYNIRTARTLLKKKSKSTCNYKIFSSCFKWFLSYQCVLDMHTLPPLTNAVSPFQANSVLVKHISIYILEDTIVHINLLWPFCLFFSLSPFYFFTIKQKCFIHSNILLIQCVIFTEGSFHRLFIGWSNSASNKKNSYYYRVFLTVCRLSII